MGWYDAVYGRPGHGVNPGQPTKKGLARFFEILGRDFGQLLGANALCCLLCLIPALLISMGVTLRSFWLTLIFSLFSGLFVGAALLLLTDCVLRSLQDDPAPWSERLRRTFAARLRQCLPLGIVTTLALGMLSFVVAFIFGVAAENGYYPGIGILLLLGLDLLVCFSVFGAAWAVLCLCDSKDALPALLLRGCRLILRSPARCIGGGLLLLVYGASVLALFPVSIFWIVLFGFWLPALVLGLLYFPALSAEFTIPHLARAPQTSDHPVSDAENKRRRRADWWHYHWGMLAVGMLLLMGSAYVAHALLTTVDPDYTIAVVTPEALPDAATVSLETALEALCTDANGDGRVVVLVNNYTWSKDATATEMNAQMAGAARMNTDLAAGDSAIWVIADPAGFDESYGALTETYGADWADRVLCWEEYPVLEALSLGTYSTSMENDTKTPVQALFAPCTVALLGKDNALWQTLSVR